MKTILQFSVAIALSAVCLTLPAKAQWLPIKSIYDGASANDGATSFVINGKGYIIAGSSTSHFYEYDVANNSWTDKGAIPATAGQAFGLSFVLNNKAYLIGGDISGKPVGTVWMFDPTSATPWTKKKDFPGGVRDAGVTFVLNNTGYAGLGFDGAAVHSDVWKYNETADSWTSIANPLPTAVIFSTAFVTNNKAYVTGGGTPPSGVSETQEMWEFDAASENWIPSVAFPGAARQAAFAFGNNAFGYVGGGMSGYANVYKDVWQFDPVNRKWNKMADVPLIGPAWSSVFTIGTTAYLGLGAAFTSTGLTGDDKFYKYQMAAVNGVNGVNGKQNNITLYPNPASDMLHIGGLTDAHAAITVYDAKGRQVLNTLPVNNTIDTRNLAPGLYMLRIAGKDEAASVSFLKQ